jgi:two-component system phosphate regulon response regulator PhoB
MTGAQRGRSKGLGEKEVLVVEDDDSISGLLRIVLEQKGYIVKRASDYTSAAQAIQEGEPALIILDIGLPDGNGLDLLKWVRDELGLKVPVVVLSAYQRDDKVQKAFELGANDFLGKPFRPKELMARIERVLDL